MATITGGRAAKEPEWLIVCNSPGATDWRSAPPGGPLFAHSDVRRSAIVPYDGWGRVDIVRRVHPSYITYAITITSSMCDLHVGSSVSHRTKKATRLSE